MPRFSGSGRVFWIGPDSIWVCGSDPDWNPDPNLGRQNEPQKKDKSEAISCFEVLNVLFEGLKCTSEA